MTVDAARKYGKWVGVCGGWASEPEAIPHLLALGIHELSASMLSVPQVKSQIRGLSLNENRKNAEIDNDSNNSKGARYVSDHDAVFVSPEDR
jgi:phosphoenolpyruvate-protein kinase (PTS system EI component)